MEFLSHSRQLCPGRFQTSLFSFPKHTTFKLQPLDADLIANWKVLCRKRMLQYVCSQVDGEKTRPPKSSNPSTFLRPMNGGDKPGMKFAKAPSQSAFKRPVCVHVVVGKAIK